MPGLELRWQRAFALLAVGLVAGAVAVGLRELGAFAWLEHRSVEARFSIRGQRAPSPEIVVIAVDIETVRRAGRYPLPRMIEAELVDELRRAGAKVVAFDLRLEDRTDRVADLRLARALERTGAAVVGVKAIREGGRTQPLVGRVPFDGVRVRPGHMFLPTDSDTVVRRFPAAYKGVASFAVVAAALKDTRTRIADAPAGALIDFRGGTGTVASVSGIKVLDGRFTASSVRGKIAVVGASETVEGDVHATAVAGAAMPGPEIQANAIATALAGYPLRMMSSRANAALLLVLPCAAALLLLIVKPRRRRRIGSGSVAVVGALALVAWTAGAQLAFGAGTVVDYSAGVFALLAWSSGAGALVATADRRERQEQRRLFADFSPEAVRRVLDHSSADPAALENTEIIAGYRIDRVIGEGGMGVVYRATQLSLSREVALKLIRHTQSLHPEFRARFKREAAAAALVGHPNIVPIHDAGEDRPILYISMQLVDGIDLAKLLHRVGPLDGKLLVSVVRQIAAALDAAHARGLVHRDVKPANILLTTNLDHAYLTDFGVAKQLGDDDGLTRPGGWIGTIDYLAPEIIDGQEAGPLSDIYALTAVLYHCATGAVPFDLPNHAAKLHAHVTAAPPSVPAGPAALDGVIARGMAKDPAGRFATASELAAATARAFGGDEPEAPISSPGPHSPGPGQGPTEVAE